MVEVKWRDFWGEGVGGGGGDGGGGGGGGVGRRENCRNICGQRFRFSK